MTPQRKSHILLGAVKAEYWKNTRIGIFQVVGQSSYEMVSRGECPVCHAHNLPVILVNGHKVIGIHRRFGTDLDCEGSFQ